MTLSHPDSNKIELKFQTVDQHFLKSILPFSSTLPHTHSKSTFELGREEEFYPPVLLSFRWMKISFSGFTHAHRQTHASHTCSHIHHMHITYSHTHISHTHTYVPHSLSHTHTPQTHIHFFSLTLRKPQFLHSTDFSDHYSVPIKF